MSDLVPVEAELEASDDPGAIIIASLDRAKSWLAAAATADLDAVADFRSTAEAIRCYVAQKELGHDAELAATEIVRRAERRIGELVREGQAKGEILKQGRNKDQSVSLRSPSDFTSQSVLTGNQAGAYAMTDGVTEDEFEEAISEAREERDLSRVNIVRKLKGETTRDRRERRDSRHPMLKNTRHMDSNRIVRETVHALEGLVMGLEYVQFDDLDPDRVEEWTESLTESLRTLNRFKREMTR